MTTIANVTLVVAAGAAAAAAFAVVRSNQPAPSPPPPPAAPGGAGDAEPASTTGDYLKSLFGAWSGLLTTAGAIAASVGTYQLAKDIGKGDASGNDHVWSIIATASFAFGIALLITIPVSLRARNRATIADAVQSQRRWNWFDWMPIVGKHRVVSPSSLFGYDDIIDFEDEMQAVVTEARNIWLVGNQPPDPLIGTLNIFKDQRRTIEASVAASRVRSASRRAVVQAGVGMILAVAGFADATYTTNQTQRAAAIADEKRTFDRTATQTSIAAATKSAEAAAQQQYVIQGKVLDAALAQPDINSVLPAIPSDALVAFPDAQTAADTIGVAVATLEEVCWASRSAQVFDVGASVDPGVPRERIVFVVLIRTAKCPSAAVWIDPKWLEPASTPPASTTPAAASTAAPGA